MKKAKLTGLIGIALILSAALLIALTAFFGVFDFNRKVNEFVDTLPGNEEDIATPLPDEPETTLPDVTPNIPSSEPPTVAEAASYSVSNLDTVTYLGRHEFTTYFSKKGSTKDDYEKITIDKTLLNAARGFGLKLIVTVKFNNATGQGTQDSWIAVKYTNSSGNLAELSKIYLPNENSASDGTSKDYEFDLFNSSIQNKVSTTNGTLAFSSYGYEGRFATFDIELSATISKNDFSAPDFNIATNTTTSVPTFTVSDNVAGLNRVSYTYNGTSKGDIY